MGVLGLLCSPEAQPPGLDAARAAALSGCPDDILAQQDGLPRWVVSHLAAGAHWVRAQRQERSPTTFAAGRCRTGDSTPRSTDYRDALVALGVALESAPVERQAELERERDKLLDDWGLVPRAGTPPLRESCQAWLTALESPDVAPEAIPPAPSAACVHQARRRAHRKLLKVWSQQMLAGRPDVARPWLLKLRRIGHWLQTPWQHQVNRGGVEHGLPDDFVADVVSTLEADPDPRHSAGLVAAYFSALQLHDRELYEAAAQALEHVQRGLRASHNPLALQAALDLGRARYYAGWTLASRQALETLLPELPGERYPHLLADTLRCLALLDNLADRRIDLALYRYDHALKLLQQLGDQAVASHVAYLQAEAYSALGSSERAWEYINLGARLARGDSARLFALAHESSALLASEGLHAEALIVAQAALRNRRAARAHSYDLALAYMALAERCAHVLGDPARVRPSLLRMCRRKWRGHVATALQHAVRMKDRGDRQRARAHALLSRSGLLSEVEPQQALADVSEASRLFEELGLKHTAVASSLVEARARTVTGATPERLRAYAAARGLLEHALRSLHLKLDDRLELGELLGRVLGLELEARWEHAQGPQRAELLELVERYRAEARRASWAVSEPDTDTRLSLVDAAREQLEPHTRAVVFHIGERHSAAFVVSRDDVVPLSLPVTAAGLRRLVDRLLRALERPADEPEREFQRAGQELDTLLLAPLQPYLQGARQLVIVPHRELHAVPFAALWDGTRYRVEREPLLVTAPSLSVWAAARQRLVARRPDAAAGRVLIVADPALPGSAPHLQRLPGALAEGHTLAREVYPHGTLLSAGDATPQALLQWLEVPTAQQPEVVALATHGSAHRTLAGGALQLASDPQHPDGLLRAETIARLRLRGTRLVTLSSCHAAVGRILSAEGAVSLARAWQHAGVPAVIASLWRVPDEGATEFMVDLHRRIRAGDDPALALRHAQRTAIVRARRQGEGSSALRVWATFTLLGASAGN